MSYLIVGLFGLALGSFLNVCIVRLPRGESVVTPRSHCPQCGHVIRWYDNIPVLSYLWLRGRCRDCGERISPMYPLVELGTAGMLLTAFLVDGWGAEFVKHALLIMLLIILVFTDLTERRIPHAVTITGMAIGLGFSFFVPVDTRPLGWLLRHLAIHSMALSSFIGALAGAAVGGGLFYAVGQAFYFFGGRRKQYLGFGDVMLMLMIGTFLGVPLTLLTVLLGSLLGSLVALPFEVLNSRFRHYQWPYGSFLGAAGIYTTLWGNALMEAYLRWSGFGR